MSTSGTVTFTIDRSTIISSALRIVAVLDPETGTATSAQLTGGGEALNMMLKSWEAYGLHLYHRKYVAVFPQKNQQVYVLGSPGPAGDHACISTPMGTGYVSTTLTTAIAVSGTSAICTSISTTGTVGTPSISILTTWNVGIQQTDGTRFWTTVNGAPVGTTLTLTAGLTIGADAGASVISYAVKLVKPLRILDGFTRQFGGNDVPHLIISREQYNRFGMKSSSGTSIQSYFDPQINTGNLYVYPTTRDVTQTIFYECQMPIEDITGATDNMDLPQEWIETVKWGLALRLAFEYGIPKEKLAAIKTMADSSLALVDSWDVEPTSLFLQPDAWAYQPAYSGSNK